MNRGSWPARSRGVVRSWGSQLMTFRHQRFALSPMNTCSGCGRSPRPRALTSYRQKVSPTGSDVVDCVEE
jgi:hypothetical protein